MNSSLLNSLVATMKAGTQVLKGKAFDILVYLFDGGVQDLQFLLVGSFIADAEVVLIIKKTDSRTCAGSGTRRRYPAYPRVLPAQWGQEHLIHAKQSAP
ncbi:MAG: hypothetical protein R2824_14590 [Saprospiraceae bacterium]